ncbi:MAG: crossover junction endodeoxyribonuclease RuvC [Patescibacteria group bacterium]
MKTPEMHKSRRILGIDPGFDRLGLAVVEGDPGRPLHIWSDCVLPKKGLSHYRLHEVYRAIETAIETYAPDAVALETLFFSTNKKTAFAVAEARGAVMAALGKYALPVVEFSPGSIKLAVTGHGGADKDSLARMVPHLLTLPPKKRLDDEIDAIAIAITGLSTRS